MISPADPLSALIAPILARSGLPGTTFAVVHEGQVVRTGAVGWRDATTKQPMTPDAPALLYSVTKTFLAAATLRLVETFALDLDAPVNDIPGLSPGIRLDDGVTPRRLLNHTAGLPDYGARPDYQAAIRADPGVPWDDGRFLALASPPLFAPGRGWAYSNLGFLLVRRLVEQLTRRPIGGAMSDLVFTPLGLGGLTMATTLDDTRDLMPGWSTDLDDAASGRGAPGDIRGRYHPGWVAHGTARASAATTALAIDGILGGRLLSAASLADMLDPVALDISHPLFRRPAYGLGLMLDSEAEGGIIAGHAGGGPGYATAALRVPAADGRHLTIAALANQATDEVALRVALALADGIDAGTVSLDVPAGPDDGGASAAPPAD